jgi:hypothetical protein
MQVAPRVLTPEERHRLATAPLPTFNVIAPTAGLGHRSSPGYNHDPIRVQTDNYSRRDVAVTDGRKKKA